MIVEDLIMLLRQCDETAEVEILTEDREGAVCVYPIDIEENDGCITIQTTPIKP